MLMPALAERLTLLINHVLSGESVATERLRPHAGFSLSLRLKNWPALLPAPPALAWRITPAGLLEWAGPERLSSADLAVSLDAADPAGMLAQALAGTAPQVQIEGNALLAADVNWLMENLRWDVAADLDRLFGPQLAMPLHQLGSMLSQGLRAAMKGAGSLGEHWRARRA